MASQRTILITGCSDGSLGAALALAFHRAGWRVLASARNTSKLKNAEQAGIETLQLDTVSDESMSRCVSRVRELTGGSLDVLVNNAGAGYAMPVMDLDLAQARDLFNLNVWSLVSVTRAFLPLLLESTRGGMVVNNTSTVSVPAGAMPFFGAYNASKAAAASLTEALRLELEPFGIRVINLMTGGVRSTFHDNAPTPTLPSGSMYNVAKEALEEAMSGVNTASGNSDADEWAGRVAKRLSRRNPPHWVWQGKFSTIVRIASHLPVGFFDGMMKSIAGLDVLERKIKEQVGLRVIRESTSESPVKDSGANGK
ncbi:putative IBR finger domain protein [Parachaetomium inaequale]|uniref:IBR finger domain protein n=1 Tax=Parachaetomium inaequale TaxID=2588326 RepID=A0AAN6PBM1_9PEZI|nr:putative IBR finger domain protein [Parachaetomium inaequale]